MKMYSLPIFALLLLLTIETNEPMMSIDYDQVVAPGDMVTFSIHIENTTVYQCNSCMVYIDTELLSDETIAHIDSISPPFDLPVTLSSNYSVNGELSLWWGPNTPDGDYEIPIVFEGTLGNCDGGCFPFRVQRDLVVSVARSVPKIQYTCNRVCDVIGGLNAEVPVTFTNTGAGDAKYVKLSLYGDIEGYVSPDSFSTMFSSESYATTIYINTANMEPGFYDLGVNLVYYDEYFKLYSEKIFFRVQVRPQRPQMEIDVLHDGRDLLVELRNEGGLKAKDIGMAVNIDGSMIFSETIDEINTTGSVLVPISIPDEIYGEVTLSVGVDYYGTGGELYYVDSEMFLNIPLDSSRNDYTIYYIISAMLVICAAVVLVRNRWKRN